MQKTSKPLPAWAVNFKAARKALNLTPQELGEKAKIGHNSIRRIENGQSFTKKTLLQTAKALGVPLSKLFEGC